jgi:putative membrane protein
VTAASAFTKPPLERNILDWMREFNKSSTPAAFNGQEADVVGFVYREPSFAENQFMVARFTISCCVADSSAIGLPVHVDNAAQYSDGQWVRIKGTFEAGEFREHRLPILQAAAIEVIAEPEQPYLYP